jgi:hypothetical protein
MFNILNEKRKVQHCKESIDLILLYNPDWGFPESLLQDFKISNHQESNQDLLKLYGVHSSVAPGRRFHYFSFGDRDDSGQLLCIDELANKSSRHQELHQALALLEPKSSAHQELHHTF